MIELIAKCGTPFMVDDDVAQQIRGKAWYLDKDGYVARKTTIAGKKGRKVYLHRQVVDAQKGPIIDHADQNKLNNTRSNLRIADKAKNGMNLKKKPDTTSRHKGVTWNKQCNKWQATIKANGKNFYLGVFHSEDEAGHVYNKAAIQLHGEFASLNPVGVAA